MICIQIGLYLLVNEKHFVYRSVFEGIGKGKRSPNQKWIYGINQIDKWNKSGSIALCANFINCVKLSTFRAKRISIRIKIVNNSAHTLCDNSSISLAPLKAIYFTSRILNRSDNVRTGKTEQQQKKRNEQVEHVTSRTAFQTE